MQKFLDLLKDTEVLLVFIALFIIFVVKLYRFVREHIK